MNQRNNIIGGRPVQSLVRKLVMTCGISWMHQQMVPAVPRAVAALSDIMVTVCFLCTY